MLIEDGTITWIGREAEAPAFDRKLDAQRANVLPGLIDSHVHFDALAAAKHLQSELDSATEIFPITMRQTLASGVTTARAHLSALEDMALMRELGADDCFPSPRIVLSGPGLLGGAPQVDGRLMRGVTGPDDAAVKIRELAGHGAQWAALHGLSRFSEAERAAIFAAAAESDMKLMADGDDFEHLQHAVATPIVSVEYLNRSTAEEYPAALIAAIGSRQQALYVVPPVGYYLRSVNYDRSRQRGLNPSVFQFVDDTVASEMSQSFAAAFEADQYIRNIVDASPTFARKFSQLAESGASLVIGSDSGSLGQFHHDAIWQEMEAWRKLGAFPTAIVDAATRQPAQMLGRGDLGRIAIGAKGDIVLYDGNVLEGEFDRSLVRAVIKGGVVFVADGEWVGPDTKTMRTVIRRVQSQLE